MLCFVENPENWYGSEKKNRYLGTDGAESVRESFIGEEFRSEHSEERSKEEGVNNKMKISVSVADSPIEESEELEKKHTKSGEEESTHYWIKYGVWRVIVSPILITEKIVFDERCGEGLGECSE